MRLVRAEHGPGDGDAQRDQSGIAGQGEANTSRPENLRPRGSPVRRAASPARAEGGAADHLRSALSPSKAAAKEASAEETSGTAENGHTANGDQVEDDLVGFLLSAKGIPPLRTPWNPGIFYDVPLNTTRFPNTIPHSYPTAQQVRTFLGKIQGIRLYAAGPWQERRQSVLAPGYTPPATPTLFRNFTAEAFETWRSGVGSVALVKEMYMEPVRGLLTDYIIKQDRVFYNLFNWYRELFPLEMIATWSVLP